MDMGSCQRMTRLSGEIKGHPWHLGTLTNMNYSKRAKVKKRVNQEGLVTTEMRALRKSTLRGWRDNWSVCCCSRGSQGVPQCSCWVGSRGRWIIVTPAANGQEPSLCARSLPCVHSTQCAKCRDTVFHSARRLLSLPVFKVLKLRSRELTQFVKDHGTNQWSQDYNAASAISETHTL